VKKRRSEFKGGSILLMMLSKVCYLQVMLVSNFDFDLVRNPNPKTFLPSLHYLFSFDLNHCFQLVYGLCFSFLDNFFKFGV
jgi:hypothetical protein